MNEKVGSPIPGEASFVYWIISGARSGFILSEDECKRVACPFLEMHRSCFGGEARLYSAWR